jgi:hypothetical protein
LLREGFLKMEQATHALNHCQRNRCSFDDALQELGYTINTRMQDVVDVADEPHEF